MPTPEERALQIYPDKRDLRFTAGVRAEIAAAIREAVAEATGLLHKCHVCGRQDDARHLLDVKSNFPGGMKQTCLECVGRLAMKEEAVKVINEWADNEQVGYAIPEMVAAIRSLT